MVNRMIFPPPAELPTSLSARGSFLGHQNLLLSCQSFLNIIPGLIEEENGDIVVVLLARGG